jgi:hypothetical protein
MKMKMKTKTRRSQWRRDENRNGEATPSRKPLGNRNAEMRLSLCNRAATACTAPATDTTKRIAAQESAMMATHVRHWTGAADSMSSVEGAADTDGAKALLLTAD